MGLIGFPLGEAECRRENRVMVGGHLLLRLHSFLSQYDRKLYQTMVKRIVTYFRIFYLLLLLLFEPLQRRESPPLAPAQTYSGAGRRNSHGEEDTLLKRFY